MNRWLLQSNAISAGTCALYHLDKGEFVVYGKTEAANWCLLVGVMWLQVG